MFKTSFLALAAVLAVSSVAAAAPAPYARNEGVIAKSFSDTAKALAEAKAGDHGNNGSGNANGGSGRSNN